MFLSYDTVEAFAIKRNPTLSFPFLKENGELLSVSINAGMLIEPRALELYRDIYQNAYKLTERYPQYYRFTLGMVLDLERGGLMGNEGQKLAQYIRQQNFVSFDTSDVRKLETLYMLGQAGELSDKHKNIYAGIVSRVDEFIQNPSWYMKFNKPLFYDLTHIIFFLTDYGTTPSPLENDPYPCLMHMGVLALLDNDADLLSEVCLCLLYIGRRVPQYWDDYLIAYQSKLQVTYEGNIASALNPSVDEYHIYLVLNAYLSMIGKPVFKDKFKSRTPSFSLVDTSSSVLSNLSTFAHENGFHMKSRSRSLSVFISTLTETDSNHWHKTLASTDMGKPLVHTFSGLS